jgi:hypothetical protein
MMNWIVDRLKEHSTWVGIGTIAAMAGLSSDAVTSAENLVLSALAFIAIVIPHKPAA